MFAGERIGRKRYSFRLAGRLGRRYLDKGLICVHKLENGCRSFVPGIMHSPLQAPKHAPGTRPGVRDAAAARGVSAPAIVSRQIPVQ